MKLRSRTVALCLVLAAALDITISSISLTNSSGTAVPVLNTPVELELRHLGGTF